jgi:hypothetical protein
VAGSSYVVSNMDYLTLKYNTSGDLLWEINYNSPYNKNDRATNMAIDSDGDIIVTGQCERDSVLKTYYAVKYVEHNVSQPVNEFPDSELYSFDRNRGQLLDSIGQSDTNVIYYCEKIGIPQYFQNDRISFVTNNYKGDTIPADTLDQFDVIINKSNSNLRVRAFDQTKLYTNYYRGNSVEPVLRNNHYRNLYYHEPWPGVDLVINFDSLGRIKYTLICSQNTDVSEITFELSGHQLAFIDSAGSLLITTTVAQEIFSIPFAYVIDQNNDIQSLAWSPNWVKNNANEISFSGSSENQVFFIEFTVGQNIIHDCLSADYVQNNCWWSTYLGLQYREQMAGLDVDQQNNKYVALQVFSFTNQQLVFFNSLNPIDFDNPPFNYIPYIDFTQILKFDFTDKIEWIVMYTGNHHVTPTTLKCSNNEVYFAGHTLANDLFTINADQPDYGSSTTNYRDGYVAKCTDQGIITWSTYIGNEGNEVINGIALDSQQSLFIIGEHIDLSPNDNLEAIFLTGAYNHQGVSNTIQPFICKYSNNLERSWLTFLGGNEDGLVMIEDIAVVGNRLLICGSLNGLSNISELSAPITSSTYFPIGGNTNDYIENTHGNGRYTGFLTEFDLNTLAITWSTAIAGTSTSENALAISGINEGQNYYYVIAVESFSLTMDMMNGVSYNGFFQNENFAFDNFENSSSVLIKFKNRVPLWSTYYGGIRQDRPYDVLIDFNHNIFMCGFTASPYGSNSSDYCTVSNNNEFTLCTYDDYFFIDPTYNHSVESSLVDEFIVGFNGDNEMIWSTYFGGATQLLNSQPLERAECMAIDPLTLQLYVGGTTTGGCFPIFYQSNAYNQYTFGEGQYDSFLSKFDLSQLYFVTDVSSFDDEVNELALYPNPGNEFFYIKFNGLEKCELLIYDICGKVVKHLKIPHSINDGFMVSMQEINSGMYVIELRSKDYTNVTKWIKQ